MKSKQRSLSGRIILVLTLWLSIAGIFVFLADFGYENNSEVQEIFNIFYFIVLIMGLVSTWLRYKLGGKIANRKALLFDILSSVVIVAIILYHFVGRDVDISRDYFYHDVWVKFAILLTFVREMAEVRLNINRTYLNPAQLFIVSFMAIILVGSFLLMLPKASYDGLSFLDALFTATSAVCVTGLIVVDTATFFTPFGQGIILLLIQLGGLGILTFASYFSYFFKGGSTYENQLVLSDMTNSQKLSEAITTVKRVLLITFSIEIIGAILIFFSLEATKFSGFFDHVFFSFFHSVSSFCNAGFSTLSDGLYDEAFRYNYTFQFLILLIFVLGGLGFPIVVNLLRYLRYRITRLASRLRQDDCTYRPWVLTLTSRITLITTFSLTAVATVIFLITEWNNTLAEHSIAGKVINALFGAATPRTAGFNTVDMGALSFSTVMVIFLLMWIGASPASTGGGIKTNTFAIATLNFLSLARGKSRIEVFRREISEVSIQRAFAVIALSLMVIGFSIMLISIFDSEKSLLKIAFETFSAYSTVGLSLGITSQLSSMSKLVIIFTMFVGRVSMLSILIAIFRKVKNQSYRYPKEEITIN